MEYPPNNTLYVNNLNEKVKKEGKPLLALQFTPTCAVFVI